MSMDKQDLKAFKSRVKAVLKARGSTQKHTEDQMGVSSGTLTRVFGGRKQLDAELLGTLARVLDLPAMDLVEGTSFEELLPDTPTTEGAAAPARAQPPKAEPAAPPKAAAPPKPAPPPEPAEPPTPQQDQPREAAAPDDEQPTEDDLPPAEEEITEEMHSEGEPGWRRIPILGGALAAIASLFGRS